MSSEPHSPPSAAPQAEPSGLSRLLLPRSVAIIGASGDPTRIGGRPLHYLKSGGFAGRLLPINPNREQVQGIAAYPSIQAVGEPVDLAIIAVPAEAAMEAAEACATQGVGGAVIFSADFAESGAAGRDRQKRLTDIAASSGMRIVGPNCLGLYNAGIGLYATFTSLLYKGFPTPGRVMIVSQSGGYGAHMLAVMQARGVEVGYWLTTGNECDVEIGECIAWAAAAPDVSVIAVYAEGVRSRDNLVAGLQAAATAGKPVLFMKSGQSAVGAEAASTHTAALAGSDAVYEGVFRQFGAYRIHTTEAMADAAYACSRGAAPANGRVGLLSISGAVGVQMADSAEAAGLEVAPLPAPVQAKLKALIPYGSPRNPVDFTAQAINDLSLISANYDALLESTDFGSVIGFFTVTAVVPSVAERLAACLAPYPARYPDRLLILCILGDTALARRYEDFGYLVFEDSARAVAAAAAAYFSRRRPPSAGVPPAVARPAPTALLRAAESEGAAKALLAAAGIATPPGALAEDATAAGRIASEIGFPLAMKIASPQIPHKTEIGGVMLGIDDRATAEAAFATLLARAQRARPEAAIEGVLVERMLGAPVAEMILGVQNTGVFGPVVLCGLGGVFAELFRDVAFRLAPFDAGEARRMLEELRAWPLLQGFRGRPAADIDALCEAIARLSSLAWACRDRVESLDLNPLMVFSAGQGVVAADALVVLSEQGKKEAPAGQSVQPEPSGHQGAQGSRPS